MDTKEQITQGIIMCLKSSSLFLVSVLLFFSSGCHREITNNGIPAALATNKVFRVNCLYFQTSTNSIVRYKAAQEILSLTTQYIRNGHGVLTFDNIEELLGPPDRKTDSSLIYNMPLEPYPELRLEFSSMRPRRVDLVIIPGKGDR